MKQFACQALTTLAMSALACIAPSGAAAQPSEPAPVKDGAIWELTVAPFALHWHRNSEHRHVVLLGLERIQADGSLWGGAVFSNSFGQASAYAYYGHEWNDLWDQQGLYFKLTGGLLYGYRGRYKDKVPMNHGGFSPALIPAVGYRFTRQDALQAAALGNAGVLFSYNRRF